MEISEVVAVFADDLFRYLLPRRTGVFNPLPPRPRSENLPIVFHPYIGMAVLCESERNQRNFIQYFVRNYPIFIGEKPTFVSFCVRYAIRLVSECEDVRKAMITIASMILELGAFCHVRGHELFKFYSSICWYETFRLFLAKIFFFESSWYSLMEFVSADAKTYMDRQHEVLINDSKAKIYPSWLMYYDYWVSTFRSELGENVPTIQELPQDANGETILLLKIRPSKMSCGIVHDSFNTVEGLERLLGVAFEPVLESIQEIDQELLTKFKSIICEEVSSGELLKILESKSEQTILMKNKVFVETIRKLVRDANDKLKLRDILEIAKIILLGNEYLAAFVIDLCQYLESSIRSMKTSQMSNNFEPNFEFHKIYAQLLEDFKHVISDVPDSAGSEICKIFDFEENAKFLMSDHGYRAVMEHTIIYRRQRWGNDWLLLFTKSILSTNPDDEFQLTESGASQSLTTFPQVKTSHDTLSNDDSQTPRGACSEPIRFHDPDDKFHLCDPVNSEDVQTVHVDIVDPRNSFNKLIDMQKEAKKSGDRETIKDGATQYLENLEDQVKAKSKRQQRKRKYPESKSEESALPQSVVDALKESISSQIAMEEIEDNEGEIGSKPATSMKESDKNTSVAKKYSTKAYISNKLTKAFKKIVDQMPIPFSSEISDWIFQQMMETHPQFLQSLKHKEDIDEATLKEFLKYLIRFHEINKESQSLKHSALIHSQSAQSSVSASTCSVDKSYLY